MASRIADGRASRPFRRIRAIILANSDICWICGHAGARTIDHVITRKECLATGRLDLLNHPGNLRPAHGALNRCPTCDRCCNQSRGTGEQRKEVPRSRTW